jgi:hypothetical protein
MPLLVVVDSIHYSPKDSETATKELLIVRDLDQALGYIDQEHLLGYFKDGDDQDEDSGYYSPSDEWWEQNPTKRAEAEALGLEISEYGSVSGTGENLTRWLSSNDWKDADDAYYGVTHYDWSKRQEISDDDVATLLRLGLAKDIREWKPDEDVQGSDSAAEGEADDES